MLEIVRLLVAVNVRDYKRFHVWIVQITRKAIQKRFRKPHLGSVAVPHGKLSCTHEHHSQAALSTTSFHLPFWLKDPKHLWTISSCPIGVNISGSTKRLWNAGFIVSSIISYPSFNILLMNSHHFQNHKYDLYNICHLVKVNLILVTRRKTKYWL